MGQFNDFRNANRDNWRFTYKGSELLSFAQKKYDYYTLQERKARDDMASLLKDVNIRASDPKIEELKASIERHGNEREKCMVWVHEFKRNPEKEFSLALGDVSYFDIAPSS